VNYLKACPDPHAAEVLSKLEKIDPEAVRRAATLAGFAAAIESSKLTDGAAETSATDGDPGDPSTQPAGASPPVGGPQDSAVSAAEAELAARIPPVLGDEDATDETVAVDPSRETVSATSTAAPGAPAVVSGGSTPVANPWASTVGKWCGVAFLLAAVAALSRLAMRSSGAA
jgi:hypothetical protein